MKTILNNAKHGGLDARITVDQIFTRALSARKAVAAAIDHAKAVEPTLLSISTVTFESALNKSETQARRLFSGVPSFNKSILMTRRASSTTTCPAPTRGTFPAEWFLSRRFRTLPATPRSLFRRG